MNLLRFIAFMGLCAGALIGALFYLKGPQVFTLDRIAGPKLPIAELAAGDLPGDGSQPSAEAAPMAKPPVPTGPVPSFGNGPGTPPPAAKLYGVPAAGSDAQALAVRAAVGGVTVIGCSGSQKAALKITGEDGLRTITSGDTLHLAGNVSLVARIVDRSKCRIVLLDHGRAVGEVASF